MEINEIMRFNYTGKAQCITLSPGKYKLECFGAQGGDMSVSPWTGKGGLGGYAKGILNIVESINLWIFVGSKGQGFNGIYNNYYGGWNGGGTCYGGASGGGGATDISLYGELTNQWNYFNHFHSRLIVAGGGGGSNDYVNGGNGGGTSGTNGISGATPGTQTTPGAGWLTGGFGIGAGYENGYSDGGAGGSGWYGGGKANGNNAAGGGGSGYVYTPETSSYYPEPYLINESYYLQDTEMKVGTNSGDGYAMITVLELFNSHYITDRLNSNIFKNIFPEEPIDMSFINRSMENTPISTEDIKQDNHGFKVNDVLYFDGLLYHKAIAENSSKAIVAGIVSKISSPNIFTLMNGGIIPYEFKNLTDTSFLYLSDKTPGTLVHFKEITNTAYIPVAVYTDHKIIINIQQGTYGNNLVPYQEQNNPFDSYTEQELDDIANQIISGVIS